MDGNSGSKGNTGHLERLQRRFHLSNSGDKTDAYAVNFNQKSAFLIFEEIKKSCQPL